MVNYDKLPAASAFFDGKLYAKMNDDLQLAGMSKRTVHGYLRAVRQLADYCERRPNKITEAQLRKYFLYLKNEKNFAYGICFPPKDAITNNRPRRLRPSRPAPYKKR